MISLLGIAGETGTLLAEFKKKIRDKESHEGFQEKAAEELGDIRWYPSNIASRLGLSLSGIASKNLQKRTSAVQLPAIRRKCFCTSMKGVHQTSSFTAPMRFFFRREQSSKSHLYNSPIDFLAGL